MAMVRQFNEDAVLEKVLEVFWTRGWLSTSMADLALATEVQRGSLYHAYGGKDRLFELAFDRYSTRLLEESKRALLGACAESALEQFFSDSIKRMICDTPPRGCFTTKTAVEGDSLSSEIQARLRTLVERQEAVIIDALSRQEIRDSLTMPPETAARLITLFTRGLAVMERIYHDPDQLYAMSRNLITLLIKSPLKSEDNSP